MTGQLLVQELRTRVLDVESTIQSISLANIGKETRSAPKGRPFDFDMDLNEKSRNGNDVRLGYRLTFGRSSAGRVCRISGEAFVHFSSLNPDADLQSLDAETTTEMAVAIFRKNFETIYLLHDAVGIEAPSPWVTQDVSMSSRNEAIQSVVTP